jgi:transposase InsO family protein
VKGTPPLVRPDPRPGRHLRRCTQTRLEAMGIRDRPIARGSPWQNGFAERLIGSIRRECLDHVIVVGEAHLRRILRSYCRYYNEIRTHTALWTKTRRSGVQFRASVPSDPARSWADSTIITLAFRFSVHTTENLIRR